MKKLILLFFLSHIFTLRVTTLWVAILATQFSYKQIEFIQQTSSVMLKKRMKPFPHFENYLFSLISFITSDQTEESFTAWQTSLNKLIETATSHKVIAYLEDCNNLFSENLL